MERSKSFRERIELKVLILVIVYILLPFPFLLIERMVYGFISAVSNDMIWNVPNMLIISQIIYSGGMLIVFSIWFFKDDKNNKNELIPRKGDFGVICGLCAIVGMYSSSMAGSGLLYVTGVYDNDGMYSDITSMITEANFLLTVFAVVIVAPIMEEILFRGLIFKNLRRKYSFWVAALATTLIFVIAHANLYQGLAIFPVALFFSYLYEKFGKIWVPILAHMWNNLLATLANKFIGGEGIEEELIPLEYFVVGAYLLIIGGGILFLMAFCLYKSKYPKGKERKKLTKPVPMEIDITIANQKMQNDESDRVE